jgi:hypothetical protein
MIHRNFREMLDEMLEDPDELFITSNSRHCALVSLRDGTTLFFVEGDFSGTPEENEAKVRRILNQNDRRNNGPRNRQHVRSERFNR